MRLANVVSACFLAIWMGLLTIGATGEALSCGIDWRLPQSHFEGVDEQGHVLYSEKIGDLDAGENLHIPLHIMFKSEWMASSPNLGRGWMLPLLDPGLSRRPNAVFGFGNQMAGIGISGAANHRIRFSTAGEVGRLRFAEILLPHGRPVDGNWVSRKTN